uniref:Uncharacterized protein n=1 Tax=Ditylenchus dipsaci TaxID=166011 RepID=A0A915DQ06_9BILA
MQNTPYLCSKHVNYHLLENGVRLDSAYLYPHTQFFEYDNKTELNWDIFYKVKAFGVIFEVTKVTDVQQLMCAPLWVVPIDMEVEPMSIHSAFDHHNDVYDERYKEVFLDTSEEPDVAEPILTGMTETQLSVNAGGAMPENESMPENRISEPAEEVTLCEFKKTMKVKEPPTFLEALKASVGIDVKPKTAI